MRYRLSRHAIEEANRRGISEEIIAAVLEKPEQVVDERGGKKAFQSRVDFGHGKEFLVRVIVDDRPDPIEVITVYRTTRVKKYWRAP